MIIRTKYLNQLNANILIHLSLGIEILKEMNKL